MADEQSGDVVKYFYCGTAIWHPPGDRQRPPEVPESVEVIDRKTYRKWSGEEVEVRGPPRRACRDCANRRPRL